MIQNRLTWREIAKKNRWETVTAVLFHSSTLYRIEETAMLNPSAVIFFYFRFSADFLKDIQKAAENHMIQKGT